MNRYILLPTLLLIAWLFGGADEAYRAYKRGDYVKAFNLYHEAYMKDGSTKAAYNLAILYEKGIGVKRDLQKAIDYFKEVEDVVMNLYLAKEICFDNKMLPYYKKSLEKLYRYDDSKYAAKLLKSIKAECNKEPKDPYLTKCPAAMIIPKDDRIDLADYDCALFKHYANIMKSYLHLAKERKIYVARAQASNGRDRQAAKQARAIHQKIKIIVSKLMRYELQKTITCLSRAVNFADAEACMVKYRRFADKVMGCEPIFEGCAFDPDPKASCLKERIREEKILDAANRQKLIKRLLKRLKSRNYFTGDCQSIYMTL